VRIEPQGIAMWWWRKVRKANIPDDIRAKLEQFGETVIAMSLSTGIVTNTGQLSFLNHSWPDALAWLQERRDIHERREDRLETVEIAILVFVFLGVVLEVLTLIEVFMGHGG
jgi:hypothetical protein